MSASNSAVRKTPDTFPAQSESARPLAVPSPIAANSAAPAVGPLYPSLTPRVPSLRVLPLQPRNPMRRFARVPTHAVGVFPEQREYPRASLRLPLRLRSVNGFAEDFPITLVTRDISSTGVFFLSPRKLAPETPIELEVVLVSRPMGKGNVVIVSKARVTRIEPAATPGWFGIAANFEDLEFDRDDSVSTGSTI